MLEPELKEKLDILLTPDGKGPKAKLEALTDLLYIDGDWLIEQLKKYAE